MKQVKIGTIFLVSIMALAGIGAGYSAWTDTIYIDGSVTTGSVEWVIVPADATFVYKVYDCDPPEAAPEKEIVILEHLPFRVHTRVDFIRVLVLAVEQVVV